MVSSSFQKVVDAKQEERKRALATAGPVSSDHTQYVTATAVQIVSRIEKGEWTASQVIEAFISRAALAHETTNCLTEVMFEWARKQAKALDEEFASTRKLRGPLHGVPVSFKDQYDIAGFDTSIGFSQWANKPAASHCSPNNSSPRVPSCSSRQTSHRPCSLSSVATLYLGARPTPITPHIPVAAVRVEKLRFWRWTLKPSFGRVTSRGARGPTPGFEGIRTVAGPMGRCVEDLKLFCRTSFGVADNDVDVFPLPFRDVELPPKLRFAYYTTDNFVKASPACRRAVLETVDALRRQGHDCVEVELPDAMRAFEIFVGLSSSDGYKTMLSHLGPDPKEKALFLVSLGPSLPSFVRSFATWIIEKFVGDPLFARALRAAREKPMGEYMKLVSARNEYAKFFYKEVWDKHGLDGLIAPVQAMPQLPHGGCEQFIGLAGATTFFNLVDSSVGTLPVTRVDPGKDQVTEEWIKGPGHGSTILEGGLFTSKSPLYDPEAMKGLPVGIQIAGRKWEEEKVLAMMAVIDEALGGDRGFGPGSWDRQLAEKSG